MGESGCGERLPEDGWQLSVQFVASEREQRALDMFVAEINAEHPRLFGFINLCTLYETEAGERIVRLRAIDGGKAEFAFEAFAAVLDRCAERLGWKTGS